MTLTSYDEIYEEFIFRCKVDDIDLPNTPEKIYVAIRGAVKDYNNKLRDNIVCDDQNEQLNRSVNEDQLLIIAHFLRLIFLKNQLIYFTNTWQPFSKDIGMKNFQAQLKSLASLVDDEKKEIDHLIINTLEDFL